MSGREEEAPPESFSNIRHRFEQLSSAGPSQSSATSVTRRIGLRVSSDRLHDRAQPGAGNTLGSSRLSLAPEVPPRHRALSNPNVNETNSLSLNTITTDTSSSPSSPLPSPTTPTKPIPPYLPSRYLRIDPGSAWSSSPSLLPIPPPSPSGSSTGSILDEEHSTQSVASLRNKFATLSPSQTNQTASLHPMAIPSSKPFVKQAAIPLTQQPEPSLRLRPQVPIVMVRTPTSDEIEDASDPLSASQRLPRPSSISAPPTPPRPQAASLRLSPKQPVRTSSPPPLPSRTSRRPSEAPPVFPSIALNHQVENLPTELESEDSRNSSTGRLLESHTLYGMERSQPPTTSSVYTTFDHVPPAAPTTNRAPPVPPRPALQSISTEPIASNNHQHYSLPPPLPTRKKLSLPPTAETFPPTLPPRVPRQMAAVILTEGQSNAPHLRVFRSSSGPSNETLLPPPTRTIGSKDTLPVVRRPPVAESDDSSDFSDDEEPDSESPAIAPSSGIPRKRPDDLPDASHSNRRIPAFRPAFHVHAQAHISVVAVAGNCVCVGAHSVKVYDLDSLDSPLFVFDIKEAGPELRTKETQRITAMEFRPAVNKVDEGRYLWCGLRDGHLLEYDAWTGQLNGARANVHHGSVSHIIRFRTSMITVCENGKVVCFESAENGDDLSLSRTSQPIRNLRIPEKQGFVRMFGSQLWTANGPGNNNAGAATSLRGPSIRVYDLLQGSGPPRILTPSEPVGQVTCGSILPSQPENIYIGHEGGHITIWAREGADGSSPPIHIGTIKVGTSDVLALEGVRTRLWAGFRHGMIAAYDVETDPWTVTNMWRAHEEYPVLKIVVDPHSIEKCARLTVYSIGRDERVRFWDGLLAIDHIEAELLKREGKFSTFQDLKILLCTWNIDSAKPEFLSRNGDSVAFLGDCLQSLGEGADAPDIIVFGFQEVINLEDRKLTAKTVFLSGKRKDGTLSDNVSTHYRLWLDQLVLSIRTAMPVDCPYSVLYTENLVGLLTCIFVKTSERSRIRGAAITTVKRGLGGRYGNKGAIAARFTVDDSSICFINCHLAAGQKRIRDRNQDAASILEEKSVFPTASAEDDPAFVGGGDGSMILDHETCFLSGDLNYRIDQRRENVISSIRAGELDYLLQHDQLVKEMRNNPALRLRLFREAPIAFDPTYKYDRFSSEYDSSKKRRIPAWCDRILYRCRDPDRIQCLHYQRYEPNISDHRPVSAGFLVTTKLIDSEGRDAEKEIVESEWRVWEQELLREAHQFYTKEHRL